MREASPHRVRGSDDSSDALPATFDRFARDECRQCGDTVQVRYLDGGVCVGCRERPPAHRATDQLRTDGGVDEDQTDQAAAIAARPHPRTMAIDCIRAEATDLTNTLEEPTDGDVTDAIHQRFQQLNAALRRRLGIEYPACPHCGASLVIIDGEIVACHECFEEIPMAVSTEWHRVNARIWNGGDA